MADLGSEGGSSHLTDVAYLSRQQCITIVVVVAATGAEFIHFCGDKTDQIVNATTNLHSPRMSCQQRSLFHRHTNFAINF